MPISNSACYGCFVNPPHTWVYNNPVYVGVGNSNYTVEFPKGLSQDEKDCLLHLVKAYEIYDMLDMKHVDDNTEFRRSMHDLQRMIGVRVARRIDMDVWK